MRIATATATAPTTLLVIALDEMTRVLHAEHALSDHFITYMLERNIRIEEDLIDQLFNSSEKRPRANAAVACALRQAGQGQAEMGPPKNIARDPSVYDRHHPITREFLYEEI